MPAGAAILSYPLGSVAPLFAQLEGLQKYFEQWVYEYPYAGLTLFQWVGLVIAIAVAYGLGIVLQGLTLKIAKLVTARTEMKLDDEFIALLPGPLKLFFSLFVLSQLLRLLDLAVETDSFFRSLLACGLIVGVGWLLLRLLGLGAKSATTYFSQGVEGTPQARAIQTQVSIVRTVLRFIIVVAAIALMLMQFEVARTLGVSLLASASVAGIAVGFAAQRTVATLFAGIQLAFTQSIKIGDVVVVEGEWGTIEDIRLTFVVVKIWDLRRLIIPVTYFIEKPIENWTSTSTEILGTVYIYTDYTVPVEEVRQELKNILDETDLWDKKVQGVVVTSLTEKTAEVRCLVSAANSSDIWNLRCLVREKLLTWLQSRGKGFLPVQRLETHGKPLFESKSN